MKKLYILLIVFISLNISKAQQYFSFPSSNAVWNVLQLQGTSDSMEYNTIHYALFGDTMINLLNYHKIFINNGISDSTIELNSINTIYCGAIREEPLIKTIYYIPKDSLHEVLLYDFNLNTNDTIIINTKWGENIVVCNGTDSININNQYRKRYFLWSVTTWTFEQWIEGIGSTKDPLFPYYFLTSYPKCNELLCFSHFNNLIYQMQFTMDCFIPLNLFNSGCYKNGVYITNIEKNCTNSQSNIIIYPNPIVDNITIKTLELQNYFLSINNVQGKEIFQKSITQNTTKMIDLSLLENGIYFLIIKNDKMNYVNKIIIQK